MSVAQRLYEGVDTPDGHVGLITYMRTDSTAIAGVAMAEAQGLIRDRFGERYGTGKGRFYKTSAKGAQEAHESIRPTSFRRDPDSLQGTLEGDELRLYRLIWQRAVASQMASKEVETTTADLVAGDYKLRASATRTLFDGYARVYTEGQDDGAEEAERSLPPLKAGDVTSIVEVTPNQHFTEPPPRFTEASLIKALEEHGIGRPSTYAATISTIVERGYVRVEQRRLHPEMAAYFVTDYLVRSFSDYVDVGFTAGMEEDLDKVASGEREWVPLLREFYPPLKSLVDEHKGDDPVTEPTDEVCSLGHPMVIRLGRNGAFMACSTFPEHKETRPLPGDETPKLEGEGDPCPQCGEGVLATKRGRFGAFVGCSRYPDCTYIRKDGPPPPGPAAVRGHLPQERRRPPGRASRPQDRQRLLGVLQLPEVRLHDELRADRRDPRRARRRQGRDRATAGRRPVPDLWRDRRAARGRPRRPALGRRTARSRGPAAAGAGRRASWRRWRPGWWRPTGDPEPGHHTGRSRDAARRRVTRRRCLAARPTA